MFMEEEASIITFSTRDLVDMVLVVVEDMEGEFGYQKPVQLLRIIKEDEPEGIIGTFLSCFDIGCLTLHPAAAVLFSAIISAGRRSLRATAAAQGRHWLEGVSDQTHLAEIYERVAKGNKTYHEIAKLIHISGIETFEETFIR